MSQGRDYVSPEILASEITNPAQNAAATSVNETGTRGDLWHKSDTGSSRNVLGRGRENENPGALAGATGAEYEGVNFKTEGYRTRAAAATALCHAIAECDPADAVILLEAALVDLSAGYPLPVLTNAMQDARMWAAAASEAERKAWVAACYDAMLPKSRRAFLAYATGRAAA